MSVSEKPVGFGLIGFGAWGSHHAQAIQNTPGATLLAIGANSPESCQRAMIAHPQAEIFARHQKLLERDDIEIVSVVLPSHLHFEVARDVLQAGKHLLLEKPMTLSIAECDELIKLARENKRLLAVGHELRLSSLWSEVKLKIKAGRIGTPQYVLVELSRRPYRLGSDGWRYDINRVGNWILEEPIHFFDFARWYLESAGEPESIYARGNSRQPDHPELQDNFSAMINFPGGAYGVVSQTLSAFEHHQTVKVVGTEGAIWASWSGAMDRTEHPSYFLKMGLGDDVQEIPINKITGEIFELEDQVAMLVRAIRENEPLMTTGQDGKWSVAMCLAAQKSVDENRVVNMSEIL